MDIFCSFLPDRRILQCRAFGNGHINSTLKVTADDGRTYVLQKINRQVFKEPEKVMENIRAVTEHLERKCPGKALHFLPARDGKYYSRDEDGEYWRLCDFVDGICRDAPESDRDFYQSAVAFGQFQEMLADFPAHTLHETIPDFHNTKDRFRQLKEAIQRDSAGRKSTCLPEIGYALSMEDAGSTLRNMLDAGELPLRVTHNDTKLNNVMLNKDTGEWQCVLDLDTVMPGSSLYDFGDSIRFGAATCAEDEPDASKMKLDLHLFRVYTEGYLKAAPSLTKQEIDGLPLGALTMTLETGIRFLTDYLNGDVYFKTDYPDHNLIRCRTQLALVRDMQANRAEMHRIVQEIAGK